MSKSTLRQKPCFADTYDESKKLYRQIDHLTWSFRRDQIHENTLQRFKSDSTKSLQETNLKKKWIIFNYNCKYFPWTVWNRVSLVLCRFSIFKDLELAVNETNTINIVWKTLEKRRNQKHFELQNKTKILR